MNRLRICFNHSEDQFPLPAEARRFYGPFGFPAVPEDRPYISSNFVQSLDGLVSFRDLPGQTSGAFVARSAEDHWLFQMLCAHHDAQLLGAGTVRAEAGADGLGSDYGVLEEPWASYRREALGLKAMIVVVASRSGDLDLRHRLFQSRSTEAWVATTAAGAERLRRQAQSRGAAPPRMLVPNPGDSIDPGELARQLRQDGIQRLLCDAGPNLYSQFFAAGLISEDFRTISAQMMGPAAPGTAARPAAYEGPGYTPSTAPWLRLISLHYAEPHHVFLRLRHEGPREASPEGGKRVTDE